MDLLVATRSSSKMAEIRRLLAKVPELRVLTPDDVGIHEEAAEEELEPYDTFDENAVSKARHFHARSGLLTVADDSGIEVDALGGRPGVRSKRFSPEEGLEGLALDEANNRYLISLLAEVPAHLRTSRYVCVAALIEGGRDPVLFRGEAPGLIVSEPRGTGGFGYDPHVLVPDLGRTYAELSAEQKDARSHRGAAFRRLADALPSRIHA